MTTSTNLRQAAILIVHGGGSRETIGWWTRLCLAKIAVYTDYPDYHIYLWNNDPDDRALEEWLLAQPRVTMLSAASYETPDHPHRTPLQRLYHLARRQGAHYIVTLDSDAHPLWAGWLAELLAKQDEGAAVAGVWRDMMAPAIRPHVHPSCLATTVDFVEQFSAQYLAYPLCLEQLALVAPEIRLLVILRNPIDRFISHLNHLITNRGQRYFANLDTQAAYLLRNYSLYTEAMLPSHYSISLTRLFRYFDRERVLVLQFERLVQSPAEEWARTYRFLGVDDRFWPKTYLQPVNQGSYIIPKPDADERARLAAYLMADVQRTATLCPEIDLSLWPDFNGV